MPIRKSHENPVVQAVYKDYLGEPGGHKAHELLHCTYVPQKRYRTENKVGREKEPPPRRSYRRGGGLSFFGSLSEKVCLPLGEGGGVSRRMRGSLEAWFYVSFLCLSVT